MADYDLPENRLVTEASLDSLRAHGASHALGGDDPVELDSTQIAPTTLGDVDLDTVLVSGDYLQPSSSNAGSANNYPEARAGSVRVIGTPGETLVLQEYHSYGATNRTWHRTYFSGTWNPWQSGDPQVSETAGRTISVWDPINGRDQLIYGDTGERELSHANLIGGYVMLRRVGQMVTLQAVAMETDLTGSTAIAGLIPDGFKPVRTVPTASVPFWSTEVERRVRIEPDGDLAIQSLTSGDLQNLTAAWFTNDTWPATLPGVAFDPVPYR